MRVGVLALQGDFREHLLAIESLGVQASAVKNPLELEAVDGLIIPGGESTTISKLIEIFGMLSPLREFAATKPVLGTCAGLILLSDKVSGALADQQLIGGLPITTERNSYGGQLQSFEGQVDFVDGGSENVAFIRAPRILEHSEVGVVAKFQDEVVAVRHGNLMAASFHPELTGATHLHKLFISSFN